MISAMEAEVFVRKTVKELLFEGYEDTMMEIGSSFMEEEEEEEYDYEKYGQEEYDDEEFDYYDEEEEKKEVIDKFGFFYKVDMNAVFSTQIF